MLNFIKKDFWLKAFSLVLAIGFWFYGIIVVNPLTETTITGVPIKYLNKNNLYDKNLTAINIEPQTVNIKVQAPRKLIMDISKKNINVTVDLSSVSTVGDVSLPISVSLPFDEATVLDKSVYYTSVTIGEVAVKSLPIDIKIADDTSNSVLHNQSLSEKTATIKAPKEILDKISSLEVNVSLPSSYGQFSVVEEVKAVSEGKENLADLVMISPQNVTYSCNILKKKVVKIIPNYDFDPTNYDIEFSKQEITIYGDEEDVDAIDEVRIRAIKPIVGQEIPVVPILSDGIYAEEDVYVKILEKQ